jgi:nucleosome-remodeling factor subunit BPTF
MKIQKVFKPVTEFEEIDITKALTTSGRVFYPKIGKKTRIDDFLARRTHLKLLEERRLSQSEKLKEMTNRLNNQKSTEEEGDVDVEASEDGESTGGGDTTLQNILLGKQVNKGSGSNTRDMLVAIGKRIQLVRSQYANLMRLGGKNTTCYSRYCNMATQNLTNKTISTPQSLAINCYSPVCLKKSQLKRDLVMLLRKANVLNNNQSSANAAATPIKTEATSDESKDSIVKVETDTSAKDKSTNNTQKKVAQDNGSDSPPAKIIKLESVVRITLESAFPSYYLHCSLFILTFFLLFAFYLILHHN